MQALLKKQAPLVMGFAWFLLTRFTPPNVLLLLGAVGLLFVILWWNHGRLSLEGYSGFLVGIPLLGILGGVFYDAPWPYLIRDASYYVSPLLFFAIGFQLRQSLEGIVLLRSFLFYVLFATILTLGETLLLFANSQPVSFEDLRSVLVGMEMQVPLAFMLVSFAKDFGQEPLLSGKGQLVVQILLLLRMTFSFSRTMYLMLVLSLVIFWFCKPRRKSLKVSSLLYAFMGALLVGALIWWAPEGIKENFLHKLTQTFQEVSADTNWNIETNIIQNWRGYETSVAKKLFESGDALQQSLGFGFGQLIPVSHGELVGVSLEEGGITILHNGYYSMLIKVGTVGVGLYVLFFMGTLITAWRKGLKQQMERPLVLYVSCAYLLATFVITGFFARGGDPWLVLLFAYGIATKKEQVVGAPALTHKLQQSSQ